MVSWRDWKGSVQLIKTSDFVQSAPGVDVLFGKADRPDDQRLGLLPAHKEMLKRCGGPMRAHTHLP